MPRGRIYELRHQGLPGFSKKEEPFGAESGVVGQPDLQQDFHPQGLSLGRVKATYKSR